MIKAIAFSIFLLSVLVHSSQVDSECQEELLGWLNVDIANCTDPYRVAAFINAYGMKVENSGYGCQPCNGSDCNLITCTRYVPPEAYDTLDLCSIPPPFCVTLRTRNGKFLSYSSDNNLIITDSDPDPKGWKLHYDCLNGPFQLESCDGDRLQYNVLDGFRLLPEGGVPTHFRFDWRGCIEVIFGKKVSGFLKNTELGTVEVSSSCGEDPMSSWGVVHRF